MARIVQNRLFLKKNDNWYMGKETNFSTDVLASPRFLSYLRILDFF